MGFSLHANTRIALRDRDRLERLFRYAARPPIAQNRLHLDQDGKIISFFRTLLSSWQSLKVSFIPFRITDLLTKTTFSG